MLFVTKLVLIYVSANSPPWNASKSIVFLRTTCKKSSGLRIRLVARRDVKACMRVSSGEGGDGICLAGASCFLAVMRYPDETDAMHY